MKIKAALEAKGKFPLVWGVNLGVVSLIDGEARFLHLSTTTWFVVDVPAGCLDGLIEGQTDRSYVRNTTTTSPPLLLRYYSWIGFLGPSDHSFGPCYCHLGADMVGVN
jgi:hypothetical protein